jgi:hypothetical protein
MSQLGSDPQVFYRAMDFLLGCEEEIQREVFFSVANLLNLEVDVIFFDSSSTYFEVEDEDEADEQQGLQGLRRFGDSKDRRPDLPQVVVGLAVTREGIPVRCWVFPGNASDQVLVRQVKDDLRAWKLNRVLWVLERRVPRLRRQGAPAHRDHPCPTRPPARARDRRAAPLPRDRARQGRVGTTRLPDHRRKPAPQAGSRLPLIYELSNSGRSYLGFHHHTALVSCAHAFLTLERLDPKAPRPV